MLFTITCGISYFAVGSGDTAPPPQRDREASAIDSEFHAWLEHPEDVHEANLIGLSIRLFPDAQAFPGLGTADVNRLDDMVVQATVRVDVSVPLWNAQIADPSAVADPARKGAGSSGTGILSASGFERLGADSGCAAV